MKIVFFGTSEIGQPILEALHQNFEVALVVTAPDKKVGRKQILTPSPIAQLAEQLNIPVSKPEKVKNNPELVDQLKTQGADLFVVVSYGKILPGEIIDMPPLKTINVHFSLLPKYRGAAPVQFALLNGESTTGTTIFVLEEDMDTGPILTQDSTSIEPDDTNLILQEKLAKLSADLIVPTIKDYELGKATPTPQNHEVATYTKILKKEDGVIDWQKPAQEIYNQYRALLPWPGIYTIWQNKTLKILECKLGAKLDGEPGQVVDNTVICGDGNTLELVKVQLEGKTPVAIIEFLNGYQDFKKTNLLTS